MDNWYSFYKIDDDNGKKKYLKTNCLYKNVERYSHRDFSLLIVKDVEYLSRYIDLSEYQKEVAKPYKCVLPKEGHSEFLYNSNLCMYVNKVYGRVELTQIVTNYCITQLDDVVYDEQLLDGLLSDFKLVNKNDISNIVYSDEAFNILNEAYGFIEDIYGIYYYIARFLQSEEKKLSDLSDRRLLTKLMLGLGMQNEYVFNFLKITEGVISDNELTMFKLKEC